MAESDGTSAPINMPDENRPGGRLRRQMARQGSTTLAMAGCLGLMELLPVGIGMGLWPSADMIKILITATAINLVLVLLYALIGAALPHSGADYLFVTRILPAPLGFAANFSLMVVVGLSVSALAVLVSQAALSPFLFYSATEFQNSELANFATSLTQPQGAIIVGITIIVLAFFISVLKPSANRRLVQVLLLVAFAGWGVIFFQLFTATPATFQGQWDLVVGDGSYAEQIFAARALSLMFGDSPSLLFVAGIPLGFLLFIGARLPVLVSGEIKGSVAKAQLWSGWLAVLVSGGLAAGAYVLLNRSIPVEWLAAESHLFLYNNSLETPALPWLPFYANLLQPDYLLFAISTLGTIAAMLAALQAFLSSFGRVILAWAEDGMLLDLAGYIHAGTQSPLIATLLFSILVLIGVPVTATIGVMKTLSLAMFALVCLLVFPAFAAIFSPLAQKRWAKAGNVARGKVSTVFLVICGVLVLVILGWSLYVSMIYPAQGSAIQPIHLYALGGVYLLGLLLFFIRAAGSRQQGDNLFKRFTRFPKE